MRSNSLFRPIRERIFDLSANDTCLHEAPNSILESSTDAVFLHVTMSDKEGKEWGSIFKSNSNGTYYNLALENVNRDGRGYTDFEKMIGLDGIAVVNVVVNTDDANISGKKELQTRITHNDGASWKPLTPPSRDSLGQAYDCTSTVSSGRVIMASGDCLD
jgi:hypothetical protein